jgi:xanthine dehydrogenase accessory factor
MKRALLDAVLAARAEKRPAVLLTALDTGAQALLAEGAAPLGELAVDDHLVTAAERARRTDRGATVDSPAGAVFVQPFNPPLRLIVVGAVHIAQSLVPMAAMAGYDVTVVDPRRAFAGDERFPSVPVNPGWPDEALAALAPDARTAIVTLTHDPKLDDPALDAALRSPAFYIASLGSRKTHAARLARLERLGHGPDALARINGPAGLAIGALTPAEIAVSILAQMTQTLRGAGAAP